MTTIFAAVSITFLFCLFLWSCQRRNEIQPSNKKTFRTCLITDLATVDTRKNGDVFSSAINFCIYEGLTRFLPSGEVELALAKSVDISKDGCTYTFHLKDAMWTDGHPITAFDFEYSWKKTLDPEFASPCSQIFFPVKNATRCAKGFISSHALGIKAIDGLTLQIELESPTPYFLSLITFCNFYPIPKHIEEKNPYWFQHPEQGIVTSGPFYLKKWTRNKEVILAKNLTYWDAEHVELDEIVFSIIPDETTALQMFENKELDFVSTITTPLTSDGLSEMKKKNFLKMVPTIGFFFCTFNTQEYPYQNCSFRKALAYAIDRSSLVEAISPLSEEPARRCISPIADVKKDHLSFPPFDPSLAPQFLQQALDELGLSIEELNQMKDLLVLTYPNMEPYKNIAETIQQQWKKILGLKVVIEEKEHKSHLFNITNKRYGMALYNCFPQSTDPTNILDRFKYPEGQKNYPGFYHPKYVELLEQASLLNNTEKRAELLDEAERLLMSYMPITPIYHCNQGVLISPEFENVAFSPVSNLLFRNIKLAHQNNGSTLELSNL